MIRPVRRPFWIPRLGSGASAKCASGWPLSPRGRLQTFLSGRWPRATGLASYLSSRLLGSCGGAVWHLLSASRSCDPERPPRCGQVRRGLTCAFDSFGSSVSTISGGHTGSCQAASRFLHGLCFLPSAAMVNRRSGTEFSFPPAPPPTRLRPAAFRVAGVASLQMVWGGNQPDSFPPPDGERGLGPRWFAVTTVGPLLFRRPR